MRTKAVWGGLAGVGVGRDWVRRGQGLDGEGDRWGKRGLHYQD